MKLTTVIGTAIAALSLAACGSAVAPTARPGTATPAVGPPPTATPAPTPTATPSPPSPTAAPLPVLTTRCAVPGTAQGGAVSWSGAGAYRELLISPGNVVMNPVLAQGQYGPLTAGSYTYEF